MWIGEQKIKGELELEDGNVEVMFKDNTNTVISKKLLKVIKHKDKRAGFITDVIRQTLATKYLADMAEYDLEISMIEHIAMGMNTLAHNLREELISKTFDCGGANGIKIAKLLK